MDKVQRYVRFRVIRMSRSESIRWSGYFSRCTPIHGTNHHESHLLQTHKQAVCLTLNLLRNIFNKWGSLQHKNQNRIITKLSVTHSSDCSNNINTNPYHTDISAPTWDQFKNHIALAPPHIQKQPVPFPRAVELATCRALLQRSKVSFRKSTLALRSHSSLMFSADRCYPHHYVILCIARVNLAKNFGGGGTKSTMGISIFNL